MHFPAAPPIDDSEIEKDPLLLTRFGTKMLTSLKSENVTWYTIDPVLAYSDSFLPTLSSASNVTVFKNGNDQPPDSVSHDEPFTVTILPTCPPISLRKFSGTCKNDEICIIN